MLPMIKLVKNYKLSLYFQTSGVILPRKYSFIKVFENRFLYNRGDLRAQGGSRHQLRLRQQWCSVVDSEILYNCVRLNIGSFVEPA